MTVCKLKSISTVVAGGEKSVYFYFQQLHKFSGSLTFRWEVDIFYSKKMCKLLIVQQHWKAVGHEYSLFTIKYNKYSYSVTETLTCCIKSIVHDVILGALIYHILSHIGMQIFFTEAVQNFPSFKSYSVKIA